MTSQRDDNRPLIAKAECDQACRVALLRSITREATGLPIKVHNSIIKLLVAMTSEAFSDGTTTEARVVKLEKALGKSKATIFRTIKTCQGLGLLVSESRIGERGNQISSKRSIIWQRVKELVETSRAGATDAPPFPQQLLEPTPVSPETLPVSPETLPVSPETLPVSPETLPVSPETPYNPYSPENPKYSTSGGTDFRFSNGSRTCVQASTITDQASQLFRTMNYHGDQGQSIWLAAAAVKLGRITESAAATAAELASKAKNQPAFFRTVIAEKSGLTSEALTGLFDTIRVQPKLPGTAPKLQRQERPRATIQAVPVVKTFRDTQNEIETNRRSLQTAIRELG